MAAAAVSQRKERPIVRVVVAATRVAKMTISQGCHPRRFFYFIYVVMEVIGICMQNLKKIDQKKKLDFFHSKL